MLIISAENYEVSIQFLNYMPIDLNFIFLMETIR